MAPAFARVGRRAAGSNGLSVSTFDEREAQRTAVRVCRAEEIAPGERKIFPLGEHGVGVFNVEGTFHAVYNYCPHEGAPVCLGGVRSTNEWDERKREYVMVLNGQVLRCPWHQWEFDLATGDSLAKPVRRVKTFAVEVVDGEVMVLI